MLKHKIKIWLWIITLTIFTMACAISLPFSLEPTLTLATSTKNPPMMVYPTPTTMHIPPAVLDEQGLLINLYARVNKSVVNITDYSNQAGELLPLGQGSGFVYDSEGHIVTNAHVVIEADQVDVVFSDGSTLSGEVIGTDLNSDLAVVKVDQLPAGVNPLPLGDLDDIAVGQTVVAIGNPFGLQGTLTRGIISALGRTIPALTPFSIPQAIQTDAAINPGNSGGPLLNLDGEVIGVNAQIETGGTTRSNLGIGFAIPVSIVKLVVPDLIENGKHEWSWLGVQGGDLNPYMAEANNSPIDRGAYLSKIVANGPADKAGLKGSSGEKTIDGRLVEVGGDIITAIDDNLIQSFDDLLIYISMQVKPGQTATLTIYRDGEQQTIDVVFEERPETIE